MADFIQFKRVEIGPENLCARVVIGKDAPLYTSEDLAGTTRIYNLLPGIIDHVCLGDAGETFKEVMGDTELAHLLEHVAVELLAQTNIAGDITSGRTKAVPDEDDTYDIQLSCPDDVLVVGALSSAAWILQWAYTDGTEPAPDIEAIVSGLVSLVESLPAPQPVEYEEPEVLDEEDDDPAPMEIPDFIRQAAARRYNEEPRRSPEAVQAKQDDLGMDDEVVSDEYVFDGYLARDEESAEEPPSEAEPSEEEAADAEPGETESAEEESGDGGLPEEGPALNEPAEEESAVDEVPEEETNLEEQDEAASDQQTEADAAETAAVEPGEDVPASADKSEDLDEGAELDQPNLNGGEEPTPEEMPAGQQGQLAFDQEADDQKTTDGGDGEEENIPGSRPVR